MRKAFFYFVFFICCEPMLHGQIGDVEQGLFVPFEYLKSLPLRLNEDKATIHYLNPVQSVWIQNKTFSILLFNGEYHDIPVEALRIGKRIKLENINFWYMPHDFTEQSIYLQPIDKSSFTLELFFGSQLVKITTFIRIDNPFYNKNWLQLAEGYPQSYLYYSNFIGKFIVYDKHGQKKRAVVIDENLRTNSSYIDNFRLIIFKDWILREKEYGYLPFKYSTFEVTIEGKKQKVMINYFDFFFYVYSIKDGHASEVLLKLEAR